MSDLTRAIAPNRSSELFQLLLDGAPRTRAELAAITGLSRSTVAMRIEALMDAGLVAPVGDATSTGGRPSSLFALNPSARLLVAADFGATHATIGLVDLAGSLYARRREAIAISAGPVVVIDRLISITSDLLADLDRSVEDISAVGIGLPGPVEFSTGKPSKPPIMPGWDGFDVPSAVRARMPGPLPVLVDNDVNIMALGERSRSFPDVENLIFVKVATGIGAGVISGGLLQRGASGIAGDIGHVFVERASNIACSCGNFGCLEAIASGPAVASALRDTGIDAHSTSDVLELVRDGNFAAIRAVRQAGRDIGGVLTTCVSLINPSIIVIGGSLAQAGEHLLAGVREVVYARSTPLATDRLQIVQSAVAADAAVVGAGALALEYALSAHGIDDLVNSDPAQKAPAR